MSMDLNKWYDELYSMLLEEYDANTVDQILAINGLSRKHLNPIEFRDELLSKGLIASTIDSNATLNDTLSPQKLHSEIYKPHDKLLSTYILHRRMKELFGGDFARRALVAMLDGTYYMHDFTGIDKYYCTAVQTSNLLVDGRPWTRVPSDPPKHPSTYLGQLRETIFNLAHDSTGACAPSDIFIIYAYMWLLELHNTEYNRRGKDLLKYALNKITEDERFKREIRQQLESFCWEINNPIRVSGDSPFVNFSIMDRPKLLSLIKENFAFPYANLIDMTSQEQLELAADFIMHIQYIYMDFKVSMKRILIFPVDTLNVSLDENNNIIDESFLDIAAKFNASTGRFNIFFTSNDSTRFSLCCRLSLEFTLRRGIDSFGNGGMSVGSMRVLTINFPRIAYEAHGDYEEALRILAERLEMGRKILYAQRSLVKDGIDGGRFIIFRYNWMREENMFSTFGIVGLYEFMNELGTTLEDTNLYIKKTTDILHFMEDKLQEYSREDRFYYNIEAVPAESAANKLYRLDALLYKTDPNNGLQLYSNQFIPLWEDTDIFTKIEVDGALVKELSGGAISHINIGSPMSEAQFKSMVRYCANKNLEHWAINPIYAYCENGHMDFGRKEKCKICGSTNIQYVTRIVGYFTPVDYWNKERRKEFWKRTIM